MDFIGIRNINELIKFAQENSAVVEIEKLKRMIHNLVNTQGQGFWDQISQQHRVDMNPYINQLIPILSNLQNTINDTEQEIELSPEITTLINTFDEILTTVQIAVNDFEIESIREAVNTIGLYFDENVIQAIAKHYEFSGDQEQQPKSKSHVDPHETQTYVKEVINELDNIASDVSLHIFENKRRKGLDPLENVDATIKELGDAFQLAFKKRIEEKLTDVEEGITGKKLTEKEKEYLQVLKGEKLPILAGKYAEKYFYELVQVPENIEKQRQENLEESAETFELSDKARAVNKKQKDESKKKRELRTTI